MHETGSDSSLHGLLAVDDVRPILAAIRQCGIRPDDAGFRGELARLFENPGVRVCYCRRSGLTIDALTEMLYDRGFTTRRVTCVEVLTLLEMLFAPRQKQQRRAQATARILSDAERKAKGNREKKFQCPECSQICRGARNTSLICGICFEIDGKIVAMRRVELTAEEVLEMLVASAGESLTA